MLPKRDWMEMTWADIAGGDTARWIAVLPLAAVEQHGPHLPLGVDTYIAEAYLARVRDLLPDDLPVTFLPVERVGVSAEHLSYPGTLTLSATTAIAAWTELGDSSGARRPAQACPRHQPRRQCRGHGNGGARSAYAFEDARGHRRLASFRLPRRHVFERREKARHPWRRHRDLADAGGQARHGAHGSGAKGDAGNGGDGGRIQMARRLPAGRLCLDDAGSASLGRGRRRDAGDCGEGRRGAGARRRKPSSNSCARSTVSILRGCATGRSIERNDPL